MSRNFWKWLPVTLTMALLVWALIIGVAFAGGKWPTSYPKFHQKEVCPNTEFYGQVTCDGNPVQGAQIQIEGFSRGEWYWAETDEEGFYSIIVPLDYYKLTMFDTNFMPIVYSIHAKWRCGVLPFYFEICTPPCECP